MGQNVSGAPPIHVHVSDFAWRACARRYGAFFVRHHCHHGHRGNWGPRRLQDMHKDRQGTLSRPSLERERWRR